MSGHSYRLETPRPRRVPSPLVFENSSKTPSILSSNNSNHHHHQDNLLYDLPARSISPPPISPRSPGRITSPTSPSYPGRARGTRNGRPTPPPNARNRSQTPQGVAPSELEQFAEYCRAWYILFFTKETLPLLKTNNSFSFFQVLPTRRQRRPIDDPNPRHTTFFSTCTFFSSTSINPIRIPSFCERS